MIAIAIIIFTKIAGRDEFLKRMLDKMRVYSEESGCCVGWYSSQKFSDFIQNKDTGKKPKSKSG